MNSDSDTWWCSNTGADSLHRFLPKFHGNISDYFEETIKFLGRYKWIYDFKITDIFSLQVPKNIPPEWAELQQVCFKELDKLVTADLQESWPQSLKDYSSLAQNYCLARDCKENVASQVQLNKEIDRGISDKKRHEIMQMSELINSCCISAGANFILDVGAGLGYLDQVIHHNYGYQIIGLETIDARMHKAEERAVRQGCRSGSGIVQKKITLTDKITDELLVVIKELKGMPSHACGCQEMHVTPTNGSNVVMTGLHCCGDLTPSMMKVFVATSDIRSLCCVGCCYHFMTQHPNDPRCYEHFPMSQQLQEVLKNFPEFAMSTYGLRLASQETKARWLNQSYEDHDEHARNVGFRAVLQVYADRCDIKLKKRKRRGASRSDFASFNNYLKAVSSSYNVIGLPNNAFEDEMRSTLNEFKDWFSSIELITALQVVMQPVLESLIIIDRCCYLKEHGVEVQLIPVFDDFISPRNMAIVAFKPH